MTTLCLTDYRPLPTAMVLRPNFGDQQELRKSEAGLAAYALARELDYGPHAAEAWRKKARKEWFPGESAIACARRVVKPKTDSATVRAPTRGDVA